MKRFTKIMLISAGVLSVIGIVLCAGGILLGGSLKTFVDNTFIEFNSAVEIVDASLKVPKGIFEIQDEEEVLRKMFQEQGGEEVYRCDIMELEALSLTMGGGVVTFIASDRYDVRICVNSQYLDVVEFQNEDGELEVEILQKKRKLLDDTPILIVQMPQNFVWNELDIELMAGQLAANELCASEASIIVQAGKVDIESLGTTEADLQVQAGAVEVGYLDAVSADIECDAGAINILDGQIDENGDITCNAGAIKAKLYGNPKDYTYDLMVALGRISLNGEAYSGISGTKIEGDKKRSFDISCNVGAIELDIKETTSQTDINKF